MSCAECGDRTSSSRKGTVKENPFRERERERKGKVFRERETLNGKRRG